MTKELILSAFRRYVRVFMSSFLVSAYGFIDLFNGWDSIRTAFQIDVRNGMNVLMAVLFYPALFAGLTGGVSALGKLLRDWLRTQGMGDVGNKMVL